MKFKSKYCLFIATLFVLFVLLIQCNAKFGKFVNGPNGKGPECVINSLRKSESFQSPEFEFTNQFNNYKQFRNIKGLFFKGLAYHGKPTKVFCWYGIPESLQEGEKVPAVVLAHGGGGTVFPQWIKKWTDRGYAAISVALEGQVPGPKDPNSPLEVGHPVHEFSGPFRKGFFLDLKDEKLENQWFYHAVADIILANSLIRSFPEVDETKIGITGISWGGILTNVVTGIDNRFAFSIPVYGCGFLYEAPTYINQLKQHTADSKKFYLETWEPSLYMPLQKQPTLFVNGTNDAHFPMNSFTRTYLVSGAEKYLYVKHEMKHGHQPGWEPESIYTFADYVAKRENAPLNFIQQNENSFSYSGKIREAVAYFTTDSADWSATAIVWSLAGVEVNKANNTLVPRLPEGTLYYFINAKNKDGVEYSTPMTKYNQ